MLLPIEYHVALTYPGSIIVPHSQIHNQSEPLLKELMNSITIFHTYHSYNEVLYYRWDLGEVVCVCQLMKHGETFVVKLISLYSSIH